MSVMHFNIEYILGCCLGINNLGSEYVTLILNCAMCDLTPCVFLTYMAYRIVFAAKKCVLRLKTSF